jgi:outer membrane receptor protein involved in Fe transport
MNRAIEVCKKIVATAAAATLLVLISQSTVAQEQSDTAERVLEEIVVSAQKREEFLQDVPISMSVLSGEMLDRSIVQGLHEAIARTPAVTFMEYTYGGSQVSVRGVGASFPSVFGSSTVAYYLDAVPFGFVRSSVLPDPDVYDLDRIEILRGPQGTLYGAGGVGGVVRVLTQDAKLDEFEFKSRVNFSATEDGGENGRADATINIPIIEGKFAARATVGYESLSGWIDAPECPDCNDSETVNGRLKLNAQPSDNLSLGLSAWISRNDRGAAGWTVDGRTDFGDAGSESGKNDLDVYNLQIGYDFAGFSLSSSTGYLDAELGAVDGNTLEGVIITAIQSAQTFVQEVNLASTYAGPWHWSLGGMYRDSEDERLDANTNNAFPALQMFTSQSWAVFGELTREFFNGQLELTVGLRRFQDDVGVRELSRGPSNVAVPPEELGGRDSEYDATTPRVVLTWHPREQLTVYASYAEGFRSGGDQQGIIVNTAPTVEGFGPDLLKNYELGAKGDLMDGRLSFDAAAYYLDWQDVQVPLLLPTSIGLRALLVNGAAADGPGAEVSLTVRPVEELELGLSLAWNDLTYAEDVVSELFGFVYSKGERLNSSPEYTIGGWADYSFSLGGGGWTGRFSASANVTARQRIALLGVLDTESDQIQLARASFSVESPNRWMATLYAENIGNENGVFNPFVYDDFSGRPARSLRLRPRTVGVQFEYRY